MLRFLRRIFRITGEKLFGWNTGEVVFEIPRMVWLNVQPPQNQDLLPAEFSSQFIKAKSIPPRKVILLRDVFLSQRGEVFKSHRIFLPSIAGVENFNLYKSLKLFLRRKYNADIAPANSLVAVVHDEYSLSNYYHWMIEALPRLYLIRHLYPDVTLALPSQPRAFMIETLRAFDISKRIFLPHREILRCAELAFPELVYYDGVEDEHNPPVISPSKPGNLLFESELIILVREKLRKHFISDDRKPFRKVYISRSKQAIRKISNEEEVISLIRRYDFEVCHFENMKFEEQLKLVNETSVYLSVHGANMVNILFLQSSAKVIEMINEYYLNDAYYLLASSIEIPYYSIPCKMAHAVKKTEREQGFSYYLNGADLVVDLEFLEKTIQLAID